MKRITFVLLYALLAGAVSAQTVYVRTQDKDGNVSPSEALSGPVGAYRFTIYPTDGGEAVDLTAMTVRFLVTDMADGKVVVSNATALVGTNYGFRGEGTLSRAVSTNTVQMMAYPDGTDPYALYWALLTVTSTPSAAVQVSVTSTSVVDLGNVTVQWEIQGDGDMAPDSTDRNVVPHTDLGASLGRTNERYDEAHVRVGHFDSLIAGTVSVENAIGFLDNTKVKLSGETNSVILTNTSVQVRSPTNATEVATKEYVDAVAGGELNVGPVQLYTNHVGDVGRTNAAGYFENINDHTPLVGTNIIFNRTYDGGRTWSNLNVTGSAWQNGETNGRGWARGPSENASGRFFDYNAVPTGVPVRCSVDIITPLQSTLLANGTWTWGLSWRDIGGTNNTLISIRAAAGSELIETYIYNLSYSAGQDTRPIAPYNAGNVALNTYNFGFKDLIFAMDHNGAGTVRYYINGALVYRATNVTPVAGFSIHASMSSAPANSTNTSDMVWDNFRGEYGLWTEAW